VRPPAAGSIASDEHFTLCAASEIGGRNGPCAVQAMAGFPPAGMTEGAGTRVTRSSRPGQSVSATEVLWLSPRPPRLCVKIPRDGQKFLWNLAIRSDRVQMYISVCRDMFLLTHLALGQRQRHSLFSLPLMPLNLMAHHPNNVTPPANTVKYSQCINPCLVGCWINTGSVHPG
jgi:hypothetical protein